MEHARAETAHSAKVFASLIKKRRSLAPAGSLYEWAGPKGSRGYGHLTVEDWFLAPMILPDEKVVIIINPTTEQRSNVTFADSLNVTACPDGSIVDAVASDAGGLDLCTVFMAITRQAGPGDRAERRCPGPVPDGVGVFTSSPRSERIDVRVP